MSERHPNVINADELPWGDNVSHGSRFGSKAKRLGAAAGGRRIGCAMYEVAPGKRAFPFHAHLANEEAIFVLEGTGTARIGDAEVPVRAGDYLAFPSGSAHPHQLINTSAAPLRYLCMSTAQLPEIAVYPDSNKVGLLDSSASPPLRTLFVRGEGGGETNDYWKGERGD